MENSDKRAWKMLVEMLLKIIGMILLLALVGYSAYFLVDYFNLSEKADSILFSFMVVFFIVYGLFRWKEHIKNEIIPALESETNSQSK